MLVSINIKIKISLFITNIFLHVFLLIENRSSTYLTAEEHFLVMSYCLSLNTIVTNLNLSFKISKCANSGAQMYSHWYIMTNAATQL